MITILRYEWKFGDGEVSNEKNPEHVYHMAGTYVGRLTISDNIGNSWSNTFTVRVYDWDLMNIEDGTHVAFTQKCYRLAIKANQGLGIVPWGIGGDLPFPEACIGSVRGFTKGNRMVSILLDNRSGLFYRFGVENIWQDKVNQYGQGKEINSMVRLKENIGINGEELMIEHVESHIHMRPHNEEFKNQSGFTDKGFLNNFRVNLKIFANGDTDNPISELMHVQQYGDYIFGNRVENKRLQFQIETTASAFKFVKIKQFLNNIDKVTPDLIGGERVEDNYQKLFSNVDLWITRDSMKPLMNRATGNNVTGSYASLVTGPDINSNSALFFGALNALTTTLQQRSAPVSILFWLGDLVTVGDLIKFDTPGVDDFIIRIVNPGIISIRLTNGGVWTNDIQLEWTGIGWVHIAVIIDTVNIYVYENGVLKGIVLVPGWLTSIGGTVVMIGASVVSMFDIRRISNQVSSDAIQWYYNDVITYNGDGGLLPVMR